MKLFFDALDHLLMQNSWAKETLRQHAGKIVAIQIAPWNLRLHIDGDGSLSSAPEDSAADAHITMSPGDLLRLQWQPDTKVSPTNSNGDAALTETMLEVMRHLHWDAEEDLSRVIGDIPAHTLCSAGHSIKSEFKRQAFSLAGMLAEYWLYEKPWIANPHRLTHFNSDVALLESNIEKLASRVEALEKSL